MFEEHEIERRAPVWHVLSELFLDNELTDDRARQIAAEIASRGFSAPQAEAILREEVAPVFWGNLLATAGEWQPWSQRQVVQMIVARLRARKRWWQHFGVVSKMTGAATMSGVRADWQRVKSCLQDPSVGDNTI